MDKETQQKINELNNQPVNTMPEGIEVYDPSDNRSVKNINQQEQGQFTSKDIGFSAKETVKKNERYTGPVTQTSYQTSDLNQSFNSVNTVVHKSHATRNKRIILVLLVFLLAAAGFWYFFMSTENTAFQSRDRSPRRISQ